MILPLGSAVPLLLIPSGSFVGKLMLAEPPPPPGPRGAGLTVEPEEGVMGRTGPVGMRRPWPASLTSLPKFGGCAGKCAPLTVVAGAVLWPETAEPGEAGGVWAVCLRENLKVRPCST